MPNNLSYDELKECLKEQIQLLQLNAKNYDEGNIVTTLQMATSIRVLFHDTSKSLSLIKQLCDQEGVRKSDFEMITTKEAEKPGTLSLIGDGLTYVNFEIPGGLKYLPKLDKAPQSIVNFDNWWNETVIKNVSKGWENAEWFTRSELIRGHANKEGGAHIDKEKDGTISELGTSQADGWIFTISDESGNVRTEGSKINQKKATVRQICYEVLVSLYRKYPQLFEIQYF